MNDEKKYFTVGKFLCPPALGIPILASLTPPDIEISFTDDNAGEKIDFDDGTDLYAISCFTPQATRALEIAKECKERGKKVVMGGMFPSFMPEECLKFADTVCIGEAENVWLEILGDFKNGCLKKIYQSRKPPELANMPQPKRDIFYDKTCYDWDEDLLQLTRGCVYNCAMCILPRHMGGRMRFRPIDEVVAEIAALKHENIYLTDDSLFFPHKTMRDYAEKFFEAVAPLKRKFFVSSTLALNTNADFIKKAAHAGVNNFYCTLNVDPVSVAVLQGKNAELNHFQDFKFRMEDAGIRFFASFGIGRDWDNPDISQRVLEICDKTKITTAEFFIFSPYPGSTHWDRLISQNRITSFDWRKYNGAHVVFKPNKQSEESLYGEFVNCWKGFYELNSARNLAHMEPTVCKNSEIIIPKRMEKLNTQKQAAISGVGIISPIGNTLDEVRANLLASRDGIRTVSKIDATPFASKLCAEFDFDFANEMDAAELATYTDPYIRLAISTARRALKDSALDITQNPEKCAIVFATCNGGLNSGESEYKVKYNFADAKFDRASCLQSEFYSIAKAIAEALNFKGQIWIVNTACSGSTAAIGLAEKLVENGRAETVLVGGADAVALSNFAGFSAIKVVSPEKIAPFSEPVGMNIGEGSAFWVLESMANAMLRNAHIYAKVIGHATSGDAYHPTQPDPRGDGAYRTMRDAAKNAGIEIEKIGCINAHASGTLANDKAEAKGILKFIGDANIPVTSTKSYTGHCMGATGIIEATCQLVGMMNDFIPPTLYFTSPRKDCENLNVVQNVPLHKKYDCFLSSNYAFAGNNAAIIVAKRDFDFTKTFPQKKRIAITSASAFTALGKDTPELLQALYNGESAIANAQSLNLPNGEFTYAGLIEKISPRELDRRVDFSGMNKIATIATSAAKKALDIAGVKISKDISERVSLTASVCRAADESAHMDGVFSSPENKGNIACFSNVTANSTAGWVSKALDIKGANITLTPGLNAGLQGLMYASMIIENNETDFALALSADEVYAQQMTSYAQVGYLCKNTEAADFKIRMQNEFETVLGEGAAAILLEEFEAANNRNAKILGEITGWSCTSFCDDFLSPNLSGNALETALKNALADANISANEIDLIVWSPTGNMQDSKILNLHKKFFDNTPMLTSVFSTGYIESSSITATLCAALEAIKNSIPLWQQKSGIAEIDSIPFREKTRNILVISSSHIGNNYALVVKV